MKVAVSSTGKNLDSQVDPRFGRCQYFVLVDTDTMATESIENTAATASGGAGIQAAQMVAQAGAKIVLTGNLGPNATEALAELGLETVLGMSGTVREAVEKFTNGEAKASQPTGQAFGQSAGPETGMGGGRGAGMGAGMGRGRGGGGRRGGGRGLGMKRWAGTGMYAQDRPPVSDDIDLLKTQITKMQEQLKRIEKRLDEMEK
ncbi:MAG: dinitrogenase iron-molybdenum cofactor biosynthesis protein [Candidatus Lokiarchaeota archaeon]|nr:dinitrogenase iron-molybdenum cofactor biosynthesis protein [Candidatus Lokiarchaeota archaeon]